MESELKPCPFCGSERAGPCLRGELFRVVCEACDAQTALADSRSSAIRYWNKRRDRTAALEAENQRLKRTLDLALFAVRQFRSAWLAGDEKGLREAARGSVELAAAALENKGDG